MTTAPTLPDLAGVELGCDVVEVARVAGLLARRPQARETLFTATEQADAVRDGVAPDHPAALRRLAARFAAKEAVVKLLRRNATPALRWTDVEVRRGPDGAPSLWLLGAPSDIAISLSHDGDTAMAVVARRSDQAASTPPTAPTTRTTPTTPTATPSRS